MRKKIVLLGGGGHCKVVIDAIISGGEYDIEGIIDPSVKAGEEVLGVRVLGNESMLPGLAQKGVKYAFISVGSVGDCGTRKKIYGKIKDIFSIPSIIHPRAVIGRDVEVGEGTFIAASATVNPGTKIGRNAIINTSSSIDHDCEIGDFAHVAPGAVLSGGVKVGDETHIGTGAKITQYTNIPEKFMLKAGEIAYTNSLGKLEIRRITHTNTGDQNVL